MDDNEFLESYLSILEEIEGKEGGDTTTDIPTGYLGIVNTLGINPADYPNNPRGLAKAVAEKNIQELKRIGVNWDELPLSMKYNALDMQFNFGSLNVKAQNYLENLKAGNYAGAINETLDALSASDPRDGKQRPVKGIALRRAKFYNLVASDIGVPTITSVDAVNQDNPQKSAKFTYGLVDGSTIVKPFTVMSLHSRSIPGLEKVLGFEEEVDVKPTGEPLPETKLDERGIAEQTKSAFPATGDEQYLDQEGPIRDTGTLVEPEESRGILDRIKDFISPDTDEEKRLKEIRKEEPETLELPKQDSDRVSISEALKLAGEELGLKFNEGGLSLSEQMDTIQDPAVKQAKRRAKERTTDKTDLEKLKDVAKFGAEFIPGVGEAMAVKRVSDAMDEKDYVGAGIETAAGALGLIPVVGDMAGKGLRTLKKADPLEIGINPAAEDGALLSNYTSDTARNLTEKAKNAKVSLNKELINQPVDAGRQVAVRLNINSSIPDAPKGLDKLQTLHDKTPKGAALSYVPFATVENVDFYVNQTGRRNIASKIKGLDVKEATGKFPAMSVNGQYNPTRNVLDEMDDDVVEIGFNPADKHLFVDMATGQAVKGADVATVIGNRVYAKGVTYMKKTEAPKPKSASDGTELPSEVRYRMKQGGVIPMKEQMSMFEDGGLMDEGNTIDPVSGNDVPPGSTQEEVRDDIPAQLSEGEFVFPADVVRYIGLEKLMQMRQQAKMGLQTMEDMGQMGNSEEAIMPDNLPFELTDLDMDDDLEYNNDTVELQQGGLLGPATGISGYVPSQVPATSFVQQPQAPVTPTVQQPTQQSTPIAPTYTPVQQQAVPTFTPEQMKDVTYPGVLQTPEAAPKLIDIINPTTGEKRSITYIPGVTEIPEGFVLASEYTASDAQQVSVTPTVGQTSVRKDDDDGPSDKTKADMQRYKDADFYRDMLGLTDAKPFSDILGDDVPGTITATGYIIGDNGERIDPITLEPVFFGKEGIKYALNPDDKPPLNIDLEGGINRKIQSLKDFRDESSRLKRENQTKEAFDEYTKSADFKKIKKGIDAQKALKDKKEADTKKRQQELSKKTEDKFKQTIAKEKKEKKDKPKSKPASYSSVREKQSAQNFKDYFGLNEGGLASRPKPKPKQMRSGGLASKK